MLKSAHLPLTPSGLASADALPAESIAMHHLPPIGIEDDYTGNSGDNNFTGTNGADDFLMGGDPSQPDQGNDTIHGEGGNDTAEFGDSFTANDSVDGGSGNDVVTFFAPSGGSSIAFKASTIVNVEKLEMYGGLDGGQLFDSTYHLSMNDGNVAAGKTLTVELIGSPDQFNTLTFDGSLELDGHFIIGPGPANDVLIGGQQSDTFDLRLGGNDTVSGAGGNDTFNFEDSLTAADTVNGGNGTDTIVLEGSSYAGGLTFGSHTLTSVEDIKLIATGHNYVLTMNDANVAAGKTLEIDGSGLVSGNQLIFNGQAETNGSFYVIGGKANDIITGGAGADDIHPYLGNDTVNGGDGNDTISMPQAGEFNAADRLDGGSGTNALDLEGDYSSGVTLQADTIQNIQTINLSNGSFKLVENDGNVASGKLLTVSGFGLSASQTLKFDGSAEMDGRFFILGGLGNDVLTGGAGADTFANKGGNDTNNGGGGNDKFYFYDAFNGADKVFGGEGTDTLYLGDADTHFNYTGANALTLSGSKITSVEAISLEAGHSFSITTQDGLGAANPVLLIDGHSLGVGDHLTFDGSAETANGFDVKGGADQDTLTGGASEDFLQGGGGSDLLDGGGGGDRYVYTAASDSASTQYDIIKNMNFQNSDKFLLWFTVSGIDTKVATGSLSTGSFDADLKAIFGKTGTQPLGADHAVLFKPDAGNLSGSNIAGDTFVIIDANGKAGYQPGQDLVILLDHPLHLNQIDTSDFGIVV